MSGAAIYIPLARRKWQQLTTTLTTLTIAPHPHNLNKTLYFLLEFPAPPQDRCDCTFCFFD